LPIYLKDSLIWETVFDIENKKKELKKLEKKLNEPDFWENPDEAKDLTKRTADFKEDIKKIEALKDELNTLEELTKMVAEDERLKSEIEGKLLSFENQIAKEELKAFLSGKYDKRDAILSIFAGAGGLDSQDWVTMLLRMYERYCQDKGFKNKILDQSFGEGIGPDGRIGIKSVSMEVEGIFAYGFLKKENGVHRLVRISPFSPKNLRHTSFALVEVLPVLPKEIEKEIAIKDEDLKFEASLASGHGGQYVQKRKTAVRIVHLPTGISASCQSERSQALNRKKAMEVLYSKLHQLQEKQKNKEINKIKGDKLSIEWGHQIRSYVLHPYKLVKDLRTNVETGNIEEVLDGNLDQFIEAEIKMEND